MSDIALVTGASGFIGRHLCRRLRQEGYRVRALLRTLADGPWDETFHCDLASGDVPAGAFSGVDSCYHLAGMVHASPQAGVPEELYHRVNVTGSDHLAQAAVAAGVRAFVYFSSIKAVADPGEDCVDESWQAVPEDPYGLSKRHAEQCLLDIGRDSGLRVCVLRPTLVYGPGVKGNLMRMLHAVNSGRFPPVPYTGNRRSMVDVNDLTAAALCVAHAEQATGRVYIVSDNTPCSTRELYEMMCSALARPVPNWSVPASLLAAAAQFGDLLMSVSPFVPPLTTSSLQRLQGSACFRSDRLQRELGWIPGAGIRESLPAIVDRYRANSLVV